MLAPDQPLTAGELNVPSVTTEGQSISNQVLFHFSDPGPDARPSDYLATVSWGDGAFNSSNDGSGSVWVVANPNGGFDVCRLARLWRGERQLFRGQGNRPGRFKLHAARSWWAIYGCGQFHPAYHRRSARDSFSRPDLLGYAKQPIQCANGGQLHRSGRPRTKRRRSQSSDPPYIATIQWGTAPSPWPA